MIKRIFIVLALILPGISFARSHKHGRVPNHSKTAAVSDAAIDAATENASDSPSQEIEFKYRQIFEKNPEINATALTRLLAYYDENLEKLHNKNYVTFVDFSLDSETPRMYLIDMRDGSQEKFLVAHGRGSDPKHTGRARLFSNKVNSYMSSLGIYDTEKEPYHGQHGISLRLRGLEKTNSAALDRGILIHSAEYVSPSIQPLGRTQGCFAVEPSHIRDVISKLSGGSLLMAWINPKLRSSK